MFKSRKKLNLTFFGNLQTTSDNVYLKFFMWYDMTEQSFQFKKEFGVSGAYLFFIYELRDDVSDS